VPTFSGKRKKGCNKHQGAVTVELALVLPLLLLLLFSIIEFAFIVLDHFILQNAVREAVREAALGKSTAEIQALLENSLGEAISLDNVSVTMEKRSKSEGSWGSWNTLGDIVGDQSTLNDALLGDQICISLTYNHPLLTSYLFDTIAEDGTLTLHAASVSLRY